MPGFHAVSWSVLTPAVCRGTFSLQAKTVQGFTAEQPDATATEMTRTHVYIEMD